MQGDQCCALHPLPQGSAGLQGPLGLTPPVEGVPFWNLQLSQGPPQLPSPPRHSQAERDIYQCEIRGVQKNTHFTPAPLKSTYCLRGKKINEPVSLQKSYSGACAGNKKVEGPLLWLWGQSCARGAHAAPALHRGRAWAGLLSPLLSTGSQQDPSGMHGAHAGHGRDSECAW